MKYRYAFLFLLFFPLFNQGLVAQNVTCYYTLLLLDSFGNGWEGATITVTVDGQSTEYTLADGGSTSIDFAVQTGDSIYIDYSPGIFEIENSYVLTNAEDFLIFGDGPAPNTGRVFESIAVCPSCPEVLESSVTISDIRAFTADLSWGLTDPDGEYLIEYDTAGFPQGMGRNLKSVFGSETTLFNLEENTSYEFYVQIVCAAEDTSKIVGPYQFTTLWANDVGAFEVLSPFTDCELSAGEMIEVALRNYGGLPQSLIPFTFNVNGLPGSVVMPQDGFYTGVIGKDSIAPITFDATFNFSNPGKYNIEVWTDLEEDGDRSNDTTSFEVISIPTITEYPYFTNFEEWEDGWLVSDDSQNPSWEFGNPEGVLINRASSGNNAWVTELKGPYNAMERSYINSPCLDFTSLNTDPRLSLRLNVNMGFGDSLWVESSIDDGETWERVRTAGENMNWYNESTDNAWVNDGGLEGWFLAYTDLVGLAGEADVRFRIAFAAFENDPNPNFEGVGIDDIQISPQLSRDIAPINSGQLSPNICGDSLDQIAVQIFNFGATTIDAFDIAYQVNDNTPVFESISGITLDPNQGTTYVFSTPFNSTEFGTFNVKVWTIGNDDFAGNDTTSFIFKTLFPLPLAEDFESGLFPNGWTSDEVDLIFSPGSHNNNSTIIGDNLSIVDTLFEVETVSYGLIEEGYHLTFDYRFTTWASNGSEGEILDSGDRLEVYISTDCGETFDSVLVIDENTHILTAQFRTVGIDLSDYVGLPVLIKFQFHYGNGDFFADLDNINLRQCSDIDLAPVILNESATGNNDGEITINPQGGVPPYRILWEIEERTPTISNLAAGTYEVFLTDSIGCTQTGSILVDIGVNTEEIEQLKAFTLAPNPTTGLVQLNVTFLEPVDLNIQVLNLVGQTIFQRNDNRVLDRSYPLDLSVQPSGIYLVRLQVNNQIYTEKLIKSR